MKRFFKLLAATFVPVVIASTPHPEGLHSKWLNKKASELVKAYGEPDYILETAVRGIIIYGDTPTVMYIYGSNPENGGACVAAYVVELDTELVLRYQCRSVNMIGSIQDRN
jgi:hypothetical protein